MSFSSFDPGPKQSPRPMLPTIAPMSRSISISAAKSVKMSKEKVSFVADQKPLAVTSLSNLPFKWYGIYITLYALKLYIYVHEKVFS